MLYGVQDPAGSSYNASVPDIPKSRERLMFPIARRVVTYNLRRAIGFSPFLDDQVRKLPPDKVDLLSYRRAVQAVENVSIGECLFDELVPEDVSMRLEDLYTPEELGRLPGWESVDRSRLTEPEIAVLSQMPEDPKLRRGVRCPTDTPLRLAAIRARYERTVGPQVAVVKEKLVSLPSNYQEINDPNLLAQIARFLPHDQRL
jgi:hypothetical protein